MQDLGDRRGEWLYNAPSAVTRTKVADINSGSRTARLCPGVALLGVAGALFAQASELTRTLVGKADVSVPGREAVVARVEVAARIRMPVGIRIPATRSAMCWTARSNCWSTVSHRAR